MIRMLTLLLVNDFFQKYVHEIDVCSLNNLEILDDALLSFQSGHAFYSFYFATFLIEYMNNNSGNLGGGEKIHECWAVTVNVALIVKVSNNF